jgi:hypothetical protein
MGFSPTGPGVIKGCCRNVISRHKTLGHFINGSLTSYVVYALSYIKLEGERFVLSMIKLIEKNEENGEVSVLDAVIGLHGDLFPTTNIPDAILVFDRSREKCRDKIFVDASREYLSGENMNILTEEELSKHFKV